MVFGFSGSRASSFGVRVRVLGRAGVLGSILAITAAACSTTDPPARAKVATDARFLPVACREDQVREFYCDGLLPMSTALGAPAPYANCPAGIESPPGVFKSRQRVARFDAAHTEWARQRAKPGHSCCYSWCSDVDVRESSQVPEQAGCDLTGAVRENYCMSELESGTSEPADGFERCPVAIRPPEVIHFSVPAAAPLDLIVTQERRSRGFAECCYGWCSRMPVGVFSEKTSR